MTLDRQPILQGLAPVYRSNARVLVLGSMPGVASLQSAQYYAHPRNAFWPIMGSLCGAGPGLAYARRLHRLRQAGVALWDVVKQCQRDGSLDSSIRQQDLALNDFAELLEQCRDLRCICLNGHKAAALFRRRALPLLQQSAALTVRLQQIELHDMPSTSPAHAAMSRVQKQTIWQQAMTPHLCNFGLMW